MFMKENRNGDIKGRAYANIRNYQKTISKEDAASLKVSKD